MTSNKSKTPHKVYLVGAGPGDPGLLTLKGREVLAKAQVVFYDHLIHPDLLRFCPQAEIHYVGKVGHGDYVSQEEIQKEVLAAVKKFSLVVRLKGGDPFLFGRGGEEAEFLSKQGVVFEVIPGVTSATAATAFAGIPLTHRDFGSSVTLVTGHEGVKGTLQKGLDWSALAKERTLVFLMGIHNLAENCQKLIEEGKDPKTPSAIIEWGTYPFQRTLVSELQNLPKEARVQSIQPPGIVIVGDVVRLRETLNWFEKKPLFSKRILVSRSREQSSDLSEQFREWGAHVLEFPTIRLEAPTDWGPMDQAIQRLDSFDWLLFSSVNGVEFFFDRLFELKKDIRQLHGVSLVAVGPATKARLEKMGLRVERQPEEFTTDAMAQVFSDPEIKGKSILFPRAEVARENIVKNLRGRGAKLEVVSAYRAVPPKYSLEDLDYYFQKFPPHLLTFASSSTVENWVALLKDTPYWQQVSKIPVAVIGPITREAAESQGLQVVGMPKEFTIPALAQCAFDYLMEASAKSS